MAETLLKILPFILLAVAGYFFKVIKLIHSSHADVLIKIVFYLGLPALILATIPELELDTKVFYLPLISLFIIIIIYFVSSVTGKLMKLKPTSLGVLLVGTMILNNGFLIPFVYAGFGNEGLARLFIFDLSNAVMVYTFVYFLACKYGNKASSTKVAVKKVIFSPPLLALVTALVMNFTDIVPDKAVMSFLNLAGELTIPLLMIALGLYFNPAVKHLRIIAAGLLIRMGGGLALGYIFSLIFGLEGLNRVIVLICSAAPVGYNTLTYSSLEKLDNELAAELVSFSVLAGIIITPLMIFFLSLQ